MNDITKTKRALEKKYARLCCKVRDVDECPNPDECSCKVAAEIRAYINEVLPTHLSRLTLNHFNGRDEKGNRLIPDEVALRAKQRILSYCWKDVQLADLTTPKKPKFDIDSRSIMDYRRKNGDNVVIYANSDVIGPGRKWRSRGKTFVASLIMREAIKLRRFPGHAGNTYDWIPFNSLLEKIKQENQGHPDTNLPDTRSCDWLVVDDIPADFARTVRSQQYISSLLDPFFFDRLRERLPTILVFKFDVTKASVNIEQSFGIAIKKIVSDKRTCLISLCDYSAG